MEKINNSKKDIKVVELFAGVGGFRLGLERSSKQFNTIWANQWEPNKTKQWAFECYTSHFGENENHVNRDIAEVLDNVPEHDLLVGGFPCQDYSVARTKAKGIEGKKGVLWWSILEVIRKTHPQLILLENVDRLIKSPSKQPGRDFGIILRTLNDEGYNVEWRVINAADYGHVQKRKRVFIFAFKKEIKETIYNTNNQFNILNKSGFFAKQFSVFGEGSKKHISTTILNGYDDLVDVSNEFTEQFHNSGSMVDGQIISIDILPFKKESKKLKDIIESNGVDKKYYINGNSELFNRYKDAKKIPRMDPEGEIYIYTEGKMGFPDSLELPARTLLTSEGSLNRSTHIIKDPVTDRFRILTPIECERINGFDDDWTNTGMPHRFRYFSMGNALVVPLIESMGKQILKIWRELNAGKK